MCSKVGSLSLVLLVAACVRERAPGQAPESASDALCYDCHGDLAHGNEAPPPAAWRQGERAGAHQAHLRRDPSWHRQIECAECHQVPPDVFAPAHLDTPEPAELTWGPLATGGGSTTPCYDADASRCDNVYCHGATLAAGGSNIAPTWFSDDSAQAACGSCHALPPSGLHPASTECSVCHGVVVDANGSFIDPSLHINGQLEVIAASEACGSCHSGPLDPVATNGSGADGKHAVHAQQKGIACTECHLDYEKTATHMNERLDSSDPTALLVHFDVPNQAGQWVHDVGAKSGACAHVACHAGAPLEWYGAQVSSTPSCPTCHKGALDPVVTNGSGSAGKHVVHVTLHAIECEACHLTYGNRAAHRNGAMDTADPGVRLVYFDTPNLAGLWDEGAASCASLACHGPATLRWYGTERWQAGACATCHDAAIGARRQVLGAGGDFGRASHHVINYDDRAQEIITDADCQTCHDLAWHMNGTIRLKDKDDGRQVFTYLTGDPASAEPFCLGCHDEDGATTHAAPLAPFSDAVVLGTMPDVAGLEIKSSWEKPPEHRRTGLTCLGDGTPGSGCHGGYDAATGAGSVNAHGSDSVQLLKKPQAETCYDCHDQPANAKDGVGIKERFSASSDPLAHHGVSPEEQAAGGTKLACASCHQPHLATAPVPLVDPDSRFTTTFEATMGDPKSLPPAESSLMVAADTTLSHDDSGPAGVQNGAEPVICASDTGSVVQRGLVLLDLAGVPSNDVVAAELHFFGTGSGAITTHLVTHPWKEGTGVGGATNDATIDGATWEERSYGDNVHDGNTPFSADDPDWEAVGGDFEPAAASELAAEGGPPHWQRVDITSLVQLWYGRTSSRPNHGLLLQSKSGGQLCFDSKEQGATAPYVTVKWYPIELGFSPIKDANITPGKTVNTGGEARVCFGDFTLFGDVLATDARALVQFDLSAIPTGATVRGAYFDGVDPIMSGEVGIYKVSRPWNEGTGGRLDIYTCNGMENSPEINGATGLEWKYHDNARDPLDVSGGDWENDGGDFEPKLYGTYAGGHVDVTELVAEWVRDPASNYGLVIKKIPGLDGGGYLKTRNHPSNWKWPKIYVSYTMTEPTESVLDSITFCLRCHDNSPPPGVVMSSLTNVATSYGDDIHGWRPGDGPTELPYPKDLEPPYRYRMDALPCTDCHDAHGSSNLYHLKEAVNGKSGLLISTDSLRPSVWQWCTACHEMGPKTEATHWGAWGQNIPCFECHRHGGFGGF